MSSHTLQPGAFNHIGLPSLDPGRSASFYCDVLGFQLVPRPAFSFDGRWLYRPEVGPMLHLIHDANHQIPTGEINTRGSHFAMYHSDIDAALTQLDALKVEYVQRTLPDHGYRQVFFRDPDGNVIEIGEWPDVHQMVQDHIEKT